jgi:hypothetical protein
MLRNIGKHSSTDRVAHRRRRGSKAVFPARLKGYQPRTHASEGMRISVCLEADSSSASQRIPHYSFHAAETALSYSQVAAACPVHSPRPPPPAPCPLAGQPVFESKDCPRPTNGVAVRVLCGQSALPQESTTCVSLLPARTNSLVPGSTLGLPHKQKAYLGTPSRYAR